MQIFKNKKIVSYLSLELFLISLEIIFKIINKTDFNIYSIIRMVVSTNIISILLGTITSLFKEKVMFILNIIIAFGLSIYAFLQASFINYIGVFMSFKASSQLGAVVDYIKDFIKAISAINYVLFIPFIIFIIIYFIIKKIQNNKDSFYRLKERYLDNIISLTSLGIIFIVSIFSFYILLDDSYMSDSYQIVSNKDLFLTGSNPSLCIKEFGVTPFLVIDLATKNVSEENVDLDYFAFANEETERDFDDSSWMTLIEEETDSTYNNLNNYYINSKITEVNDKTGVFENKNLIVIMMESVNDIIINEEYYPNFYKLYTGGWYFENNYSPRNSCATGNNEFSALTGLYSIYNECTANIYMNNTYPEAMFNLFNDKGYNTLSVHDFTEGYYYRSVIHPNMGSMNYYGVQDLGIEYSTIYGTWASDEDAMESYLNIIDTLDTDTPFMTYFTTVSSHQPYYSSKYGNLYYDMTENTDYSSKMRHYMSKLKVLDNALGILLDGLEERGILDDTVLVLFGDHYPYGLDNDTLSEVLTRSLEDNETDKVPLLIYSTDIENETYSDYTSYINLTPTIANLFNLDYDPRLYAGTDVFNEDYESLVVFADSSWKNENAYYNAITGKITYYNDFTYTEDEILNINKNIYNKMNSSVLTIKYNYMEYLYNKRKEINERTMS